jgi:hypothetical protein
MTIFGRVVRWLRGRPVWAGNRYDPGDRIGDTKSTQGGGGHQEGVVTQVIRKRRHTVDEKGLSLPSRPKGGCRHQVDKRLSPSRPMGVVVTKSTGRGLSSPSRQVVVTQLTKEVVVTKSTEGRHTVDQWGCRHQVGKQGMSSSSRQEVVTQSTEGAGTPSQPKSGDTKSTKEGGHQVNPGAGTPSQPRCGDTKSTQERGHQVNPGVGTPSQPRSGDTKSTQ